MEDVSRELFQTYLIQLRSTARTINEYLSEFKEDPDELTLNLFRPGIEATRAMVGDLEEFLASASGSLR